MNRFTREDMDKEFAYGVFAGFTIVLGIAAVAVCVYALFNPQILG